MYPFVRMAKEVLKYRKAEPLPLTGTHVTQLVCWPWDIDIWLELNNGRTLTLYDLGRIPLAARTGIMPVLRRNKWSIVVAGASIRYRRRVVPFQRVEMRSRCIGWDDRFLYMEQTMWREGDCTSAVLIRSAFTAGGRLLPVTEFLKEIGHADPSPPLPHWVGAWAAADNERPWPPET